MPYKNTTYAWLFALAACIALPAAAATANMKMLDPDNERSASPKLKRPGRKSSQR